MEESVSRRRQRQRAEKAREALRGVAENMTEYEFRTPEAQSLKRELRAWYYGAQEPEQTVALQRRFKDQFAGNPFCNGVGELLSALADQSPLQNPPLLQRHLTAVQGCVEAKSLRAYPDLWKEGTGLDADGLAKAQENAEKKIFSVCSRLETLYASEEKWYSDSRMTRGAALLALAALYMAYVGVQQVLRFVQLIRRVGLDGFVAYWAPRSAGNKPFVLFCAALVVGCTVFLLFQIPRMFTGIAGGLFWAPVQNHRIKKRRALLKQLQQRVREGGLAACGERLKTAAAALTALPADAPENADPSRAALSGPLQDLLPGVSPGKLPSTRGIRRFCALLETAPPITFWRAVPASALMVLAMAMRNAGG